MIELPKNKLGFGCYRISCKSAIHKKSLLKALEYGLDLIDTSANYTDGDSEQLIGEVLQENPNYKPFVITKAGYVQGHNLQVLDELNTAGKAKDDLIIINEQLKHSIHPEYLDRQLSDSAKRLKNYPIGCFLLHNPEYYFAQEEKETTQEEYLARLEKAMLFLEKCVADGRIESWGISSNNFVLPSSDEKVSDFSKIYQLYEKIKGKGFKIIQFPFNMIEQGAVQNKTEGKSLIDLAKEKGIKTIANRPLNAFSENGLIRLAYYEVDEKILDPHFQKSCWDYMYDIIREKWLERGLAEEELNELSFLQQMKEVWNELPSPDAVHQVYIEHFFPMLNHIWGRSLTKEESGPFYGLFDISIACAYQSMNNATKQWEQSMDIERDVSLSRYVCQSYLDQGLDYVLVGMRKEEYVEDMLK